MQVEYEIAKIDRQKIVCGSQAVTYKVKADGTVCQRVAIAPWLRLREGGLVYCGPNALSHSINPKMEYVGYVLDCSKAKTIRVVVLALNEERGPWARAGDITDMERTEIWGIEEGYLTLTEKENKLIEEAKERLREAKRVKREKNNLRSHNARAQKRLKK